MRIIQTQPSPVAIHERGNGAPLLLLHANPGDARDFDAVIPALARKWHVIAVDFPGYGSSPPLPEPRSASAMFFADVVEDLVEQLALPPMAIIGNSVGGFAAARLAARKPERVSALVLVDTGGFTKHTLRTRLFCRLKGGEFAAKRMAGPFARSYLKRRNEHVEAILQRTYEHARNPATVAIDAALWRSFINPKHDLREEAASIRCPTLLAWGKHDPVLPLDPDGRTAERIIPGARLVEFDTGHMPFAEDPDAFLAAVVPFLEEDAHGATDHAA